MHIKCADCEQKVAWKQIEGGFEVVPCRCQTVSKKVMLLHDDDYNIEYDVWQAHSLIDGETSDTHGGDFTFRNVLYVKKDDKVAFFQEHVGAKPEPITRITESGEINLYLGWLNAARR